MKLDLRVKVVPKAGRNQIAGWEGEELKIRLNAVPEKGEANEVLIAYLAKQLNIPKSHIELVSGKTSRHKRLALTGVSLDQINQLVTTKPL